MMVLEKKSVPEKWESKSDYSNFDHRTFKYSHDNVSLNIHINKSEFITGECPVSIGPPVVPIIPWFFGCIFLKFYGHLYFSFIIENYGDALTIDVNKINLSNANGKVVNPRNAKYCHYDKKIHSCRGHLSDVVSPLTIDKNESIEVNLDYPYVDSFNDVKIDFGQLLSNGEILDLPSLILRSESKSMYCEIIGDRVCY